MLHCLLSHYFVVLIMCTGVHSLISDLTIVGTNIEYNGDTWTAYEDLSQVDGGLFFV